MKRGLPELASWLYRGCDFKNGCYLMRQRPDSSETQFTLQPGDLVHITIQELEN